MIPPLDVIIVKSLASVPVVKAPGTATRVPAKILPVLWAIPVTSPEIPFLA